MRVFVARCSHTMKIIAVIPAFNEEKTIANIVRESRNHVDEVLVVNDGSTDNTEKIARIFGARVVNLAMNRGLGSALRIGIKTALWRGADTVVTLDADGQHNPKDIERLVLPILRNEADVVIGTRMKDLKGMPTTRRAANLSGNLITFLLFGFWVSDSQSGFRALSSFAARKIDIKSDRMEVSSEIIKEIKDKNLHLREIPIKSVYTNYSLSKGQGFFVGLETAFKLVLRRLGK